MDKEDRVRGHDMPLHEGESGMEHLSKGLTSGMVVLLVSFAALVVALLVLVFVRTGG